MKRREALLGSNLPRDSQDERGEAGDRRAAPVSYRATWSGVSRIAACPSRRFSAAGFVSAASFDRYFVGFQSTSRPSSQGFFSYLRPHPANDSYPLRDFCRVCVAVGARESSWVADR
jgi:hypothetical protein